MANDHLRSVQMVRRDEYYTSREDIDGFAMEYGLRFEGQRVFLPFDHYKWSEFYKYCHDNFKTLGIKELVALGREDDKGVLCRFDGESEVVDIVDSGDFDSVTWNEELDRCDVVFTNPPFSLLNYGLYSKVKAKPFIVIVPFMFLVNKTGYNAITKEGARALYKVNKFKTPDGAVKNVDTLFFSNYIPSKIKPKKWKKSSTPPRMLDNYPFLRFRNMGDIDKEYTGYMAVSGSVLIEYDYWLKDYEFFGINHGSSLMREHFDFEAYPAPRLDGKEVFMNVIIKKRA